MLRNGVLIVALLSFFSSMNISFAESNDEIVKKFFHAQSLASKGEIEQAISVYTSLIRINPQLPEVYNNLAALYLKQKNNKEAKRILEQGLLAHKGYAALYESLTAINVAMAREAYGKALQIDLKPADVTISSLALNENKVKRDKNTIVLSKVNKSIEKNKVPVVRTIVVKPIVVKSIAVKPITASKTVAKEKPLAEIKRVSVATEAKKILTKPVSNSKSIEAVLQAWSAAWSAQTVDIYLSFYHSHFKPSRGLSRKGWKQSRRLKLEKPGWIKVALSNLNIERNNGRQAVVKFNQSYQSNRYRDVSSKRMILLYTNNGWRIYQEKSI